MKVGDKVQLIPNIYTVSTMNPIHLEGTITEISPTTYASHYISVMWSSSILNKYRKEDLVLVSTNSVINNNYSIY